MTKSRESSHQVLDSVSHRVQFWGKIPDWGFRFAILIITHSYDFITRKCEIIYSSEKELFIFIQWQASIDLCRF